MRSNADQKPHEFHVTVDGKVVGIYKGKNAENLERVIMFRLEEAGLKHEVHVNPVVHEPAAASPEPVASPGGSETASAPAAESPAGESPPVESTWCGIIWCGII